MKELLISLNTCSEVMIFADGKSWYEIYSTCHRGDWLLWLFDKTMNHNDEAQVRLLTLAKGRCSNTVRHLMIDDKCIKAVDVAIAYGEGNATREELTNAMSQSGFATISSLAYAKNTIAQTAAFSASNSGSCAAYYAAHAAAFASSAVEDTRKNNQLLTANIVREVIPIEKWNIDINLQWEN